MRAPRIVAVALAVSAAVAACGSEGDPAPASGAGMGATSPPAAAAPPARASARADGDWPLFGRVPARTSAAASSQGLRRDAVGRLRRIALTVPGTVDSTPIYLGGVRVAGAQRDVFVVTTTYGRTLALDARDGRVLWTFTPPGIGGWAGTARITNASPAADPGRRWVFTASPDGLVHRLAVRNGRESPSGRWPVRVTLDPTHEKLTSSFNVSGPLLVVATGGYLGDAPPYQGHVVTIDRTSGRIRAVFNTLCSDRHRIIDPRTCPSSDSAIWARSGVTVEPRTGNLLVATGNGPYDGRRDFGDSVLRLTPTASRLLGHWAPANQRQLELSDADLGSTGPVVAGRVVVQSGKDARIHVLTRGLRLVQQLPTPGGLGMFSAPAVWRHAGSTTVFATTAGGTAAYAVRGRRLHLTWHNGTAGTSPVVVGDLLLVQDQNGGLVVYRAADGLQLARLTTAAAHWQSPVPGGGRILVAEGSANDHLTRGTLSLFVPR
jgi:hypothetical protein